MLTGLCSKSGLEICKEKCAKNDLWGRDISHGYSLAWMSCLNLSRSYVWSLSQQSNIKHKIPTTTIIEKDTEQKKRKDLSVYAWMLPSFSSENKKYGVHFKVSQRMHAITGMAPVVAQILTGAKHEPWIKYWGSTNLPSVCTESWN